VRKSKTADYGSKWKALVEGDPMNIIVNLNTDKELSSGRQVNFFLR
jgi:hypothetical protein